ncbi:unnamed protein product, partial [Polarella glacialis]
MSIAVQKQIKENSSSVSEFLTDLHRWTEDQTKEERRRDIRVVAQKKGVAEAQKISEAIAPPSKDEPAVSKDELQEGIKRDQNSMPQYYSDWDRYNPETEVEKIEDQAFEDQKAEKLARQAERDTILDEMAIQGDGDRTRTSKARPRVKINVRRSGRRVSPVDLAAPRKEEANRLFSAGRYRE